MKNAVIANQRAGFSGNPPMVHTTFPRFPFFRNGFFLRTLSRTGLDGIPRILALLISNPPTDTPVPEAAI